MATLVWIAIMAVAHVAADNVCLPRIYTLDRHAWHSQNDEYDVTREYADYNNQKFRFTDRISDSGSTNPQFMDVLIISPVVYVIRGDLRPNATFTCSKGRVNQPLQDPCFAQDSNHLRTDMVGGLLQVENFEGIRRTPSGIIIRFNVQMVPYSGTDSGDGIPWAVSQWSTEGHEVELFTNVTRTVASNAFEIPAICANATEQKAAVGTIYQALGPMAERFAAPVKPAAAQQPPPPLTVCLPPTFSLERHAWRSENSAYERSREYVDVNTNRARFTDHTVYNGFSRGRDVLRLGPQRRMYLIEYEPGMPPLCMVYDFNDNITDPCFTSNGTRFRTDVVGGALVCDNFYGNRFDSQGIQHGVHVRLTPAGIPVSASHWRMRNNTHVPPITPDHWVETFQNVNLTLPSDAFTVPNFCSQTAEGVMTEALAMEKYPALHRRMKQLRWL